MPLKTNVIGDGNDPNYHMRIEVVDDPGPGGAIGYKAHVIVYADGRRFDFAGRQTVPRADLLDKRAILAVWKNVNVTTKIKKLMVPLKRTARRANIQVMAWDPYKGAMAWDSATFP